MIKLDLHIHSIGSAYKEDSNIVSESTPENAELLLKKLNDHEVALFSITDHNRFNIELYKKIDEILSSTESKYPKVKGLVAGVEFDVKLEDGMGKCHIICIFDANNNIDNYTKIKNVIDDNLLTEPNQYYDRENFERILKKIGLNVILIACQRSSLSNQTGKHNSLSESTRDPLLLIKSGYIGALEFQKPNVEGILKNNLKDAGIDPGFIVGSDCHTWSSYPNHDKSGNVSSFHHSMARIMPTFKGLLMAFTSPKTRFNVNENTNINFMKYINIGGCPIQLTNGINAIIGENGSGKSSILKILNNDSTLQYVRKIKDDNTIEYDSVDNSHINYIGQNDIVERFSKNTLFDDSNYGNIDHRQFQSEYAKFSNDLYGYIDTNISKKSTIESLKSRKLEYLEDMGGSYYVDVRPFTKIYNSDNMHREKLNDLVDIVNKISQLIADGYYNEYTNVLIETLNSLIYIGRSILAKSNVAKRRQFVRTNIESKVATYQAKVNEASSSYDQRITADKEKRRVFINELIRAMVLNARSNEFPKIPTPINGESVRSSNGFSFNTEAAYNKKDVSMDFYERMFDKGYQNEEALSRIMTREEFKNAVRQCNNLNSIKEAYNKNFQAFMNQMLSSRKYFTDGSNNSLGNTLGEMSLAYFKFTAQNDDRNILLIDQPEDNISNLNISKELIAYFNSIRNKKQLIIVTHNPLLVVNQDVDNVVFLSKENDRISVRSGPLEYEDNEYNVLNIIAEHMDGGTDSIRKRLKVYE